MTIEKILARKYYGNHARGVVVPVNGQPTRFAGKSASADADRFIGKLSIEACRKFLVAKMEQAVMVVALGDGEWTSHEGTLRLLSGHEAACLLADIGNEPAGQTDWGPRVVEHDGSVFCIPDEFPVTADEIRKFIRAVELDAGIRDLEAIRKGVCSVLENFFSVATYDSETLDELVSALLVQDNVVADYWATVNEVSERAW